MRRVELLSNIFADINQLHIHNSEPLSFKSGYHLSDQTSLYSVRFNNYQSPFAALTYFAVHLSFLGSLFSFSWFILHFELQKLYTEPSFLMRVIPLPGIISLPQKLHFFKLSIQITLE